jgi:hypothetical protein
MLDALVPTADAGGSRGTITFRQPAAQSCVLEAATGLR